ncbi:hypothetical protein [Sphingomonas prati]|uniref:Uncharacterized protein n=1 Tax=Sphingomonas prati TaxID=1843237 RepID=A0A7W9BQG7_9SPHN|nr:hypothetical protein [Sphingomonas prati]MBB5728081.1 hypothetical protein [Sphingomonas prati]GGE83103.1 hypothetical protein GCM10011404_14760 [Sphingomonas prati]
MKHPHIAVMLNIASLGIGAVTFVLALFAFIPFLGWANWFLIPMGLVGLVLGVLSRSTTGRNVNIVVLLICFVRLSMGGGIF